MRFGLAVLAFSLAYLSASPLPCRAESAQEKITEEEYGIYRLVIAKLESRCSVAPKTLAGGKIDPGTMAAGGIRLGTDIVEDFNGKNAKSCKLAEAFIQKMTPSVGNGPEDRKKATFSRVGFDGEKRYALMILGITFYTPEDVMNEGRYVLLEKNNGQWKIAKTTSAWGVQMGLIR